jgi:alpha-tubulin suppressor-like RCC1 family protein
VAWGAGSTNSAAYPDWGQSIVPSGLSNVVAIAAGGGHGLALRADGTLAMWGRFTNQPPDLTNVLAVAGGDHHSLALRSDGTVVVWGDNSYGQTNLPGGLTNVAVV